MAQLPDLNALSREDMKSLIVALWDQAGQVKELNKRVADQAQRIAELEAQLNEPPKTSGNSSVPPSKGFKANKDKGKDGNKAERTGPRQGSLGRKGSARPLCENPDKIVRVMAKACSHCHGALGETDQNFSHAYDKINIPPVKPVITRVEIDQGVCRCCRTATTPAVVPEGCEPGTPFSLTIVALAIYLRFIQNISYQRLACLFRDLFGLVLSVRALDAMLQRAKPCFDREVTATLARLRRSRVVYSDETSVRIDGVNGWNWVFQNDEIVLHVIRPSRGHGVVEETLDGHRPALWVSDLYGAQQGHADQWQICLAHQLRDCRYAIEAGDMVFAPRMKRLILRAFAIARRRHELAATTRRSYKARLKRDMDAVMGLNVEHKDGRRLRKRYGKHRGSLFTFLDHPELAPDNNSSERALRPTATYRKVTGGFRSNWGADLYAAVRSTIGTAAKQGIHAFDAIRHALQPSTP